MFLAVIIEHVFQIIQIFLRISELVIRHSKVTTTYQVEQSILHGDLLEDHLILGQGAGLIRQ
jgi:hypothetical protein